MNKLLGRVLALLSISSVCYAAETTADSSIALNRLPGFFRFSFDNMSMPNDIEDMGLVGINYFGDITPNIYAGIGAYGSVTGSQGGLFTLGIAGGYHAEFAPHWWADANMFVGGGGGKSSLVGGGLMLRPSIGISYAFPWAKLGLHYSYISFPDGQVQSGQIGLDLDLSTDFYYLSPHDQWCYFPDLSDFKLPLGKYLGFQRNDFGILLQAYFQRAGTLNVDGNVQDGTIKLVGAELDHYFTDNTFWWLKAAGAFSGIPNGYMDVLGGLGYHYNLGSSGFALVPQLGLGAGGGGLVDTGGGFLLTPQLGLEIPLGNSFAFRVSSGYIWSPKGQFRVVPVTGELLYHLNFATGKDSPAPLPSHYTIQGWRIQAFNQTYWYVQRHYFDDTSAINLVGVQFDQLFTPTFFFSYQGAAAYQGYHVGGYATGMIGPGMQTRQFYHDKLQFFGEVLVGAGGGGGLALSGGSIIEPILGLRYAFTPIIGVQASYSQLMALKDSLNTPVLNVGLTIRFDTLQG